MMIFDERVLEKVFERRQYLNNSERFAAQRIVEHYIKLYNEKIVDDLSEYTDKLSNP